MAVIIGRVSEYDLSNVIVGGKVIFIPPDKRTLVSANFPIGSVAKVTAEKGSVTSVTPPSEIEMAAFTRDELAGNSRLPEAVKPVPKAEPIQTPSPAPTAKPQPDIVIAPHTPAEVAPGSIVSFMLGVTLNLGNYNNVKMEVTATSAEAARTAFQQEINTTLEMMQGVIKRVGA